VVQRLKLSSSHSNNGFVGSVGSFSYKVLANKDRSGIPAKHEGLLEKSYELNFRDIKYVVEPTKTVSVDLFTTKEVQMSPEEIFMLSNMPSACHSEHIRNEYFLNVNLKYDGCTCCAPLPNIQVPLTVIPETKLESYGFSEPAGYAPFQLGYFRFDLSATTI